MDPLLTGQSMLHYIHYRRWKCKVDSVFNGPLKSISENRKHTSFPIAVDIIVKIWLSHGITMEMQVLSLNHTVDNFQKYCKPKFNEILATVEFRYHFQKDMSLEGLPHESPAADSRSKHSSWLPKLLPMWCHNPRFHQSEAHWQRCMWRRWSVTGMCS